MTTTPTQTKHTECPPMMALMQMCSGYWITQMIHAVAKFQIPDLLASGPKTSQELAETVGADPRYLFRVLRALAGLGIFTQDEHDRFGLTAMSTLLQKSIPGSAWGVAIMNGEEHYATWGRLYETLQKGDRPFEALYSKNWFEYLEEHPDSAEAFNHAMTCYSASLHDSVIPAYDFSQFKKIVDIGGGHGRMLTQILQANPALSGLLYDLPSVIAGAKAPIAKSGVAERLEAEDGDFFESVPAGCDAYIMAHIIHDWDDEHSLKILRNIHQAMADNGKLLLVEHVIPEGAAPGFGKLLDINMMMMTVGGMERTEAEYRALFDAAGFKLTGLYPTKAGNCVIEGVKK
ncbi:MAG TPA: methyltransferase [Coleofasciculaceae cyanobacterium]|jgi:SAM-dependent methyltransferase